MKKPLGRKTYGSIPHVPGSRRGIGDHGIRDGQAAIALSKPRDKYDVIVVQEKLDGTNVAIAKLESGRIVPLTRSGYTADSSPYRQHWLFSKWVYANYTRFDELLQPNEWVSGEWLAQAHGTLYELHEEPFAVFDLWVNGDRCTYDTLVSRLKLINKPFQTPSILSYGNLSIDIPEALELLNCATSPYKTNELKEGVVWRVERDNKVDFLCKYVNPQKVDGKYLPGCNGNPQNAPIVWNLNVEKYVTNAL